ncbi:DUF3500 domain-containing protein [Paenibacillus sp. J2TS4]|uniref:DUF3500 domain-containing protein n=1 Tax=Paenibacillus sp. J2TS4 TaxID=2807194 RepID=UPI001B0BEC8B|nr:hypothetical protein J2TS4_53060 [Paenibacillus sp. J2TS4]
MFIGIEPQSFTMNGITYQPLATRRDAMYSMIKSLSSAELSKAKIPGTYHDVLLGPGQDGKFTTSEGIPVSSLNNNQKQLVKNASPHG